MRTRLVALCTCLVLTLAILSSAGCSSLLSSNQPDTTSSKSSVAPLPAPAPSGGAAAPSDQALTSGSGQGSDSGAVQTERMVVTNAAMQLRVADISATIASIRGFANDASATISDLQVTSDSESTVIEPQAGGAAGKLAGPASGSLTLRIPAQRLADVQNKIAKLGQLISQSSNESDVTQQHIDMAARLTNLRAEEARLRDLLNRAGKVTDLLEVERELSRVRGDIESMDAQLKYLENQAALATLTLKLEQPGPIVRPSDGGWGLGDSLTRGIQGAVELVKVLLTTVIAMSPLLVVGALIWWLVAWGNRKHRAKMQAQMAAQAQAAAATGVEPPAPQPAPAQAEQPAPPSGDHF